MPQFLKKIQHFAQTTLPMEVVDQWKLVIGTPNEKKCSAANLG